ncbi:MAG: DNA-3-methyladenine glycosylase I [Micromonosporaceae bacterium]|nr:DNA-3-methyladenine glycosylase I [Micromonosporaceae bacterium]
MDPVHPGADRRRGRRRGEHHRGGHHRRTGGAPRPHDSHQGRSAVRGAGRPHWTVPARAGRVALHAAARGPHPGGLARVVPTAGRGGRAAGVAGALARFQGRADRGAAPLRPPRRGGYPALVDLVVGVDGLSRCRWAGSTPDYLAYHDTEWGQPIHSDDGLFERLSLEAFQSGLSWLTILRKRPAFRAAFDGFVIEKVAGYQPSDVDRLLGDPGIVRNRAKIEATLANARAAAQLDGGLAALLWSYAPAPRRRPASSAQVPASSPESVAMARDLKKRGFRFVGPTTAYALMQAAGMVDDHLAGCHVAAGRPGPLAPAA